MLKSIKTVVEYNDALTHVYELMQTDIIEGSSNSDELEVLNILIKAYEQVHYPVATPNPLEAVNSVWSK